MRKVTGRLGLVKGHPPKKVGIGAWTRRPTETMQNQDTTGTSGISRSPNPTGCRIRKPAYDRAREATEAWNGQEGGFDHWAALEMLEADGVPERLGLRRRHVDYLRKSFRKLRSSDFEDATWPPVVWMSKAKIARKLGLRPRAISTIEQDLARAGLLYWTDTASRRRDGRRSRHDGRILWAYGVDFSPFAARAVEIESLAHQVKEDEIECEGLIHEIATIRCHTTILLKAAFRRQDVETASYCQKLVTQVSGGAFV